MSERPGRPSVDGFVETRDRVVAAAVSRRSRHGQVPNVRGLQAEPLRWKRGTGILDLTVRQVSVAVGGRRWRRSRRIRDRTCTGR